MGQLAAVESFASECLTVTSDFEAYGFRLPVMPAHRETYFGLRLDALADQALELGSFTNEQFEAIGNAGRHWALQHYTPAPTARRFLETVAVVTK